MPLSPRVPVSALLAWCRALRFGLDAGLSPVRVMRQQAKSGPAAARPVAARLADRMDGGDSFQDAVGPERAKFPTLFVELAAVGEQAGRMGETFGVLEEHFEQVLAARREFVKAIVWPAIMYVGAAGTIALLLLILGFLPTMPNGDPPVAPFGKRLVGPLGALVVVVLAGGFAAVVGLTASAAANNPRVRGRLEALVLPLPMVGECFRAFALHRFSVAMHMTAEAGLRVDRAITLSLRVTANDAYTAHADRMVKRTRKGAEVADILKSCGPTLFPESYVASVEVGEVSGQLAEVMDKLARQYRDEAVRKLKLLTMLAGGAVYAGVAVMVIVMIFKLFGVYVNALQGIG